MGDWIPLVWPLGIGIGGVVIALDFRNLGLRVYDLMATRYPGGGMDPRFSPDVLRTIAGLLGAVFLVFTGVQAVDLL